MGSTASWALVLLLATQLIITLLARQMGPLAISDDDYARVTIAQNLVQHPRLDPTGTSWLPFPFYVTGAAMALFGTTLDVARATQVLLALISASLLYFGARRVGHSPWLAALSAALAAALPTAARLGAATVPEYATAACMAFAMLCLTAQTGEVPHDERPSHGDVGRVVPLLDWTVLGALALYFACASRYEAWPVAALYAAVSLHRARRTETRAGRKRALLSAGIAAAFPLLWLLHGVVWHGDALFFVSRVSHYKAALGGGSSNTLAAWLGYPLAALRHEPGAAFLLVVAVGTAFATSAGRDALRSLGGLGACLAALVLVLVLGDVRGGGPTHHPERALLSLWLVAPAVGLRLLEQSQFLVRTSTASALVAAILLTVGARPTPGAFADRAEEERLGTRLRETTGAIVILTPDYGYFAVQAASAQPERFTLVDENDPRAPHSLIPAEERLRTTLARTRAPWAVVPLGLVVPGYRMIDHGSRLALLHLAPGSVRFAALDPRHRLASGHMAGLDLLLTKEMASSCPLTTSVRLE